MSQEDSSRVCSVHDFRVEHTLFLSVDNNLNYGDILKPLLRTYKSMKKIWTWLVASSQNADSLSLTIKGFLVGIIPFILLVTNAAHINLGADQLNQVVDGIVLLIQTFGGAIAAATFLWGLIRKIVASIEGTNVGMIAAGYTKE